MTDRVKITKAEMTRAATLAQQGCSITFYPDGSMTIAPASIATPPALDDRPARVF